MKWDERKGSHARVVRMEQKGRARRLREGWEVSNLLPVDMVEAAPVTLCADLLPLSFGLGLLVALFIDMFSLRRLAGALSASQCMPRQVVSDGRASKQQRSTNKSTKSKNKR